MYRSRVHGSPLVPSIPCPLKCPSKHKPSLVPSPSPSPSFCSHGLRTAAMVTSHVFRHVYTRPGSRPIIFHPRPLTPLRDGQPTETTARDHHLFNLPEISITIILSQIATSMPWRKLLLSLASAIVQFVDFSTKIIERLDEF